MFFTEQEKDLIIFALYQLGQDDEAIKKLILKMENTL